MPPRALAPSLVLSLLVAGCSGRDERAATVVPEPTTVETAPSSTPTPTIEAPSPPPVPLATPLDRTFSVLTLPAEVALETIPVRGIDRVLTGEEFVWGELRAHWETSLHPEPSVRAAIDAWARAKVDALLGDGSPITELTCHMRLSTTRAVAMVCKPFLGGDRDGGYGIITTEMARIEGTTLVPFDMNDALVPRTALRTLIRERCEREQRRRVEANEYAPDPCTQGDPRLLPSNHGVRAVYTPPDDTAPIEVSIGWSDLGDLVRADGPLASIVPHTGTHDVAVTGTEQLEARLSLSCRAGFYVSSPRPLAGAVALARRARALEPGDALTVRPEGAATRLVLQRCVRSPDEMQPLAERAAALAAAIGERAEVLEESGIWTLQWMRVDRGLALRDRGAREGVLRATVPAGTLVPALLGAIDGARSSVGYQGTWTRVFPTDAREGWSAGRYLRASLVVPPPADTMLGRVPEAHRAAAARDAMIGDLAPYGAPTPLWFIAASTPEPAVYVGVAPGAPEGAGALDVPLSRADGTLEELVLIREPEDAQRVYALVGTRAAGSPEGVVRWQLFAPGAAAPGWTLDAPTAESVPTRSRASYETRVTHDRRLWLVDFTLPDRTHVRVRAEGDGFVVE